MLFTFDEIYEMRASTLPFEELAAKFGIREEYLKKILKKESRIHIGHIRDICESDQEYPFGKYPKTKYEIFSSHLPDPIYSFVTTIHSEERSIEFLLERAVKYSRLQNLSLWVIKTVDGVKTKIKLDKKTIVNEKLVKFERAKW